MTGSTTPGGGRTGPRSATPDQRRQPPWPVKSDRCGTDRVLTCHLSATLAGTTEQRDARGSPVKVRRWPATVGRRALSAVSGDKPEYLSCARVSLLTRRGPRVGAGQSFPRSIRFPACWTGKVRHDHILLPHFLPLAPMASATGRAHRRCPAQCWTGGSRGHPPSRPRRTVHGHQRCHCGGGLHRPRRQRRGGLRHR